MSENRPFQADFSSTTPSRALHTIRGRVSAGQQMRRGLGVKRKRGDCSPPLPQSRKQTVCRAFSRFTGRSRPRQSLARSFRGSRCAARPSVGLNRLRNANTGSNLAESRHDCRLLLCLCEVFHPSCVPCSSSSFHLPYRLRSVRLERLDNAFVTLRRCEVNQTRRDFRCGNFGNVEISPKHPEPTALARLPTLTMPTALCLSRSRRALARGLPGRLRRCPAPPSTQEVDGRT